MGLKFPLKILAPPAPQVHHTEPAIVICRCSWFSVIKYGCIHRHFTQSGYCLQNSMSSYYRSSGFRHKAYSAQQDCSRPTTDALSAGDSILRADGKCNDITPENEAKIRLHFWDIDFRSRNTPRRMNILPREQENAAHYMPYCRKLQTTYTLTRVVKFNSNTNLGTFEMSTLDNSRVYYAPGHESCDVKFELTRFIENILLLWETG